MLAVHRGGKHRKEVFEGSTALAALSGPWLLCPHFWAWTEKEQIMVEALGRGNLIAGGNGRGSRKGQGNISPQGCSQGATSFSQVSLSEDSNNLRSTWQSSRDLGFNLRAMSQMSCPNHAWWDFLSITACSVLGFPQKTLERELFISESRREACSGYNL